MKKNIDNNMKKKNKKTKTRKQKQKQKQNKTKQNKIATRKSSRRPDYLGTPHILIEF